MVIKWHEDALALRECVVCMVAFLLSVFCVISPIAHIANIHHGHTIAGGVGLFAWAVLLISITTRPASIELFGPTI